jgi:hypothetical protein
MVSKKKHEEKKKSYSTWRPNDVYHHLSPIPIVSCDIEIAPHNFTYLSQAASGKGKTLKSSSTIIQLLVRACSCKGDCGDLLFFDCFWLDQKIVSKANWQKIRLARIWSMFSFALDDSIMLFKQEAPNIIGMWGY